MPWKPNQATSYTKKAATPAKAKQWSAVANAVLQKTGDDARAIKTANGVVKHSLADARRKR